MTSRRLLTLAVLAIVVIGVSLWLADRQSTSGRDTEQALYPDLKQQLDSVIAVNIYKPGDTRAVELTRKDSGWIVTDRAGYPADEAKLHKLLRGLADAKLYEEKTSNPESYKTLGVEDVSKADATGVRIELVGTASPVNLIVGKPGAGAQSSYVRRATEPKSWLINASIDSSVTPDAWLRKEIIDVSADRTQSASVSVGNAKSYAAAKGSRADADFKVEGLPKGKELSAPTAANTFATALAGLTLADVQPASAFESTAPSARATFKTFDGLIADLTGWVKDGKHFVAIKTTYDAAQAERFKIATAPAGDAKGEAQAEDKGEGSPAANANGETPPKTESPAKPNVAEQAASVSARLTGWVYEIPEYKYESLFKPLDELLKK